MNRPTEPEAPDADLSSPVATGRAIRVAHVFAAGAFVALCVLRAVVSWRNDANMDHVAGVWATMSQDLLDGTFYRPPFGPLGFGGTRWMPLFFTMHAVLWKVFGSWRVAAHLICALSLVALLAGAYRLMRRLGVARWLAFGATVTVLATTGGKYALLDVRADGLAAALNLWGVVVVLRPRPRNIALAAILFSLAFAAKVTTVFGMAAVCVWLFFRSDGDRKTALWLASATGIGYAIVLWLTNHFSNGRFLQILRATAAGGGSGSSAFVGPYRFLYEVTNGPGETVLIVLALAVLVALGRRILTSLAALFFIATLLVTMVIFGSPGTFGNHFIDFVAASAVLIGVYLHEDRRVRQFGGLALLAMLIVVGVRYANEYHDEDTEPVRTNYRAVEKAILATGKPVLAENPVFALETGQRPYVLDPFMLRVFAAKNPAFAQPLWDKLDQRAFGAVVLEFDPRINEGDYVYTTVHFGDPFLEHLRNNYEFVKQVGDVYVWKPKGAAFPVIEE